MFQRELACTAVSGHKAHEAKYVGRAQEGGSGTIRFSESTGFITKTGQDKEGLGRWSWIRLSGTNGHATRIITAYNPCKNNNINSRTTYQQQQRYFITKKKDLTCPIKLFRMHLIKQLTQWRAKGERIVLFMDHNEHTINGALGKTLADSNGLDMREAVLQHTGSHPGATFFRGSKPIDGFWVTTNLDVSNASVMPFGYGVGDHWAFIVDIPIKPLVGINPVKIVHPAGRRLNSKLLGCCKAYIDSLESNVIKHKLLKRLHMAHMGTYSDSERARLVTNINEEGKMYMQHAEKICRKIKCCRIPFSLESALWIRQAQVYQSLIRFHKGRIKNRGNLK
jgi:hypothetical protein